MNFKTPDIMKKYVFILTILIAGTGLQAQQDEAYTQYFYNKLVINPAYAGSRDAISILGLYRNQWVGFEGAPKTQSVSIHAPVFTENIGLGLSLIHDEIGISDNMTVNMAYAFRMQFEKGRLALGLNGQIKRQFMDWKSTSPIEQIDGKIPYANTVIWLPNFGVGAYFDNDLFYAGVSVPHLLENKLEYNRTGTTAETEARQRRHIFGMAGLMLPVSEDVEFHPSLLVKYVKNSPTTVDINASFVFYRTLLTGVTYRTGDSFDMIIQLYLNNNLRIGYAHDFTTTKLSDYHSGTHEILVGFDFGKRVKGIDNPRYF